MPVNAPPVTAPVAEIKPAVRKLPPCTLPVTLTSPVTKAPVVANTVTLLVPPTLTAILALALPILTLLVPELIELALKLPI